MNDRYSPQHHHQSSSQPNRSAHHEASPPLPNRSAYYETNSPPNRSAHYKPSSSSSLPNRSAHHETSSLQHNHSEHYEASSPQPNRSTRHEPECPPTHNRNLVTNLQRYLENNRRAAHRDPFAHLTLFPEEIQRVLKAIPPSPQFCWSECTGRRKAVCVSTSFNALVPSLFSVFVYRLGLIMSVKRTN